MSELLEDLPVAHLEYPLRNGAVGDWLVLGPLLAPREDTTVLESKEARRRALQQSVAEADEIIQPPAERAASVVSVDKGVSLEGMWHVVNTLEDGYVDLAQRVVAAHSACAWAYAQIILPERVATSLVLTTASPAQVWINGEANFAYQELPDVPTQVSFAAILDEGSNEILVRVATVGQGDLPMVLGLQIPGAQGTVQGTVILPTLLEPVARRQKLATVMSHAYLDQDVYGRDQRIILRWPSDMDLIDALTVRLVTPSGRIFGESNPMVQKGAKVDFGAAAQFPDGAYDVLIQPQFEEYYVQGMRVQRRIHLQIRSGKWSMLYYGSPAERRVEALEDAGRRKGDVFAEIAKSALGQWELLQHEAIEQDLANIARREVGFERSLLALLGWVARMGDLPDFPQEVTWALEENAPMVLARIDDEEDVVLASCHLLAGQSFPQRNFADLNTGEWHQKRAEEVLLKWLRATTQTGLLQGESEQSYADSLVVLSHLVDLAYSDEVAEMAAVALDKLAYQMALLCFVGAWGGSQDAVTPEWMLSARTGPLSGVARLWWGQGAFNAECAPVVSLACAEGYMLPEIIAAVGLDRQQEAWLRRQEMRVAHNLPTHVNRAAYRTGDYLLASTQGDWAAGAQGCLWKVTMGPDALIFGNRPTCSSVHAAWQQNYWRGSGAPVRLAQWQDVLVLGYGAGDTLLDFSHAYFPQAAFDEVYCEDGWAMARKGNGYVALTATGGVSLVTAGNSALRELRAAAQSIWLVQMGRATSDGTFSQFTEQVKAQPLTLTHAMLQFASLRGQTLHFDLGLALEQAFLVNGIPQPLTGFPHMESIYGGAETMPAAYIEVRYQEHLMRLDFSAPEKG